MSGLTIHVTGRVQTSECRFSPNGKPVVVIELAQPDGHTIRAQHHYPDNSGSSALAARALCSRLRDQQVAFDATNPRFKARRMDCEALHITTSHTPSTRKDLE